MKVHARIDALEVVMIMELVIDGAGRLHCHFIGKLSIEKVVFIC
jgi:hypothetical protein